MGRVKPKPADILFSRLIRERDNWQCQRCKTRYEPPTQALHCSHFWVRGQKKTRFDPRNCDALCYGCHQIWDGPERKEYDAFKRKQLGEDGYEALERRARSIIKFGDREFKEMAKFLRENGLDGLEEKVDELY